MKLTSQLHEPLCTLCLTRARVWVLCKGCGATYHQDCLPRTGAGCTECQRRLLRSSSKGALTCATPRWTPRSLARFLVWGDEAGLHPLLRPSRGSALGALRKATIGFACGMPIWGALLCLQQGWTDPRVQLTVLCLFAAAPLTVRLIVPRPRGDP